MLMLLLLLFAVVLAVRGLALSVGEPGVIESPLGSLIKPAESDWQAAASSLAAGEGRPLAPDSVIGKLLHVGEPSRAWFDAAGDPTRVMVVDLTRLLLVALLGACLAAVAWAWRRKRAREGRR